MNADDPQTAIDGAVSNPPPTANTTLTPNDGREHSDDAAFLRDLIAVDSEELRALKAIASMPPEARKQLVTLMKMLGGRGQQE